MRIITVNLNGIRSADSKGFYEWLQTQQADVICLQEIRIMHEQLTEIMRISLISIYHCFFGGKIYGYYIFLILFELGKTFQNN